jgi:hypothetical protein
MTDLYDAQEIKNIIVVIGTLTPISCHVKHPSSLQNSRILLLKKALVPGSP